jgi:hypothetical protein
MFYLWYLYLLTYSSLSPFVLYVVNVLSMVFVFIYTGYWCPTRYTYHMKFVSFYDNQHDGATCEPGTTYHSCTTCEPGTTYHSGGTCEPGTTYHSVATCEPGTTYHSGATCEPGTTYHSGATCEPGTTYHSGTPEFTLDCSGFVLYNA